MYISSPLVGIRPVFSGLRARFFFQDYYVSQRINNSPDFTDRHRTTMSHRKDKYDDLKFTIEMQRLKNKKTRTHVSVVLFVNNNCYKSKTYMNIQ